VGGSKKYTSRDSILYRAAISPNNPLVSPAIGSYFLTIKIEPPVDDPRRQFISSLLIN
jgi:hypothetical protein